MTPRDWVVGVAVYAVPDVFAVRFRPREVGGGVGKNASQEGISDSR
jgi:hypothetical protein